MGVIHCVQWNDPLWIRGRGGGSVDDLVDKSSDSFDNVSERNRAATLP